MGPTRQHHRGRPFSTKEPPLTEWSALLTEWSALLKRFAGYRAPLAPRLARPESYSCAKQLAASNRRTKRNHTTCRSDSQPALGKSHLCCGPFEGARRAGRARVVMPCCMSVPQPWRLCGSPCKGRDRRSTEVWRPFWESQAARGPLPGRVWGNCVSAAAPTPHTLTSCDQRNWLLPSHWLLPPRCPAMRRANSRPRTRSARHSADPCIADPVFADNGGQRGHREEEDRVD